MIEAIGSVKGNKDGDFDTIKPVRAVESAESGSETVVSSVNRVRQTDVSMNAGDKDKGDEEKQQNREPSKKTIDSVMAEANQKMRLTKTRCEYSYDEPTKRVSIKVYDEKTDELIREVPPEKSLEMLQKMWELAGIIIDEKR